MKSHLAKRVSETVEACRHRALEGEAEAKFSKKRGGPLKELSSLRRGQLTVTWALVRLASKHEEVEAPAEEPSEAAEAGLCSLGPALGVTG